MVFSSQIFLFLFLPVTLIGYALCRQTQLKNLWLLLVSILFYAYGAHLVVLVLLFSILRFRAMRRRHLMERLEAEEQRQLQKQREESLAKSREVQEDMMRFRETLPEAEKKASPPAERYRVTGAASEDGESETDDSIALLFESEDK